MRLQGIVFGLSLALGAVSCGTIALPPVSNQQVQNLEERILKEIPASVSRQLKETEIIIPNRIMCAYAKAIDSFNMVEGESFCPQGGYIIKNYLVDEKMREEFIENMGDYGFTPAETALYLRLLSQPNLIIINEQSIKDADHVAHILKHERIHRELNKLPAITYQHLMSVAKDLIRREYTLEEAQQTGFYDESELKMLEWSNQEYERKDKMQLVRFKTSKAVLMINPEEFYAYLIGGELERGAEEVITQDFPEVCTIIDIIRMRVSDADHYKPLLPSFESIKEPFVIKEETNMVPAEYCVETPLMIGSRYCGKCEKARDNLQKAAAELGMQVEYIDQDDPKSTRMQELGMLSNVTPVLILKCEVFSGMKSAGKYKEILEK